MIKFFPFLKIIRPVNVLLTSLTVILGFWLSSVDRQLVHLVLLISAAICAVSFGNVINDIVDIEGDRINHPKRPLPTGEISIVQAIIFTIILTIVSLITSYSVSYIHCIGTLVPISLLVLYSFFFKGTPLVGNILVSVLVAYPLIFGGIGSSKIHILILPALSAFLLNFSREIVKDIQDQKGDYETGVTTTASLPQKIVLIIVATISILNIPLLFLPFFMRHFYLGYISVSVFVVIPLHISWLICFFSRKRIMLSGKISLIIKIEMFCGLLALTIDRLFT